MCSGLWAQLCLPSRTAVSSENDGGAAVGLDGAVGSSKVGVLWIFAALGKERVPRLLSSRRQQQPLGIGRQLKQSEPDKRLDSPIGDGDVICTSGIAHQRPAGGSARRHARYEHAPHVGMAIVLRDEPQADRPEGRSWSWRNEMPWHRPLVGGGRCRACRVTALGGDKPTPRARLVLARAMAPAVSTERL